MPAVSVIIPIYKVEPYMARCARSLFGQTLEDIEFLFVDDCTPDRSIDILREVLEVFPERKEQVTVYRMPVNSGQAAVRMQGMSLARGEYVIHCDSDDYVDTNAYELLYRKAREEDLDIVTCNYVMEQDGHPVETFSGECTSVSRMLQGKERCNLFSRMTRRTLYQDIEAPVANMGEDMVIAVQTHLKARKTGHLDQVLYHYCLREDSISNEAGLDALVAREESLQKNARILVGALESRYGYSGKEPEIVHFKYKCRTLYRPFVHIPDIFKRWKGTFPEIDSRILSLPTLSLEEKFWFVLIHLRLYHPTKLLTGWLKRHHVLPDKGR